MTPRRIFHRRGPHLAAAALAIFLTACAAGGADPTPSESELDGRENPPSAEPSERGAGEGGMPLGGITEETIAELVAAAAAEANVNLDEIRLVSAEAVDWPDGGLGCNEPGMMYTQAIVPGYDVVLEIDGEEHHFHAAEGGEFFYCEEPTEDSR